MYAARDERVVDRGEQPLRVDRIVDDVERRDHVAPLRQSLGGVAHLERHPVGDAGLGRRPPGALHHRGVRVIAEDGDLREGLRQGDRGQAGAAPDVGHPGAPAHPVEHVGHQRQPLRHQQVAMPSGGEPLGAQPDVLVQVLGRDAAAGPERLGDAVVALQRPDQLLVHPAEERGSGLLRQRRHVRRGQRDAAVDAVALQVACGDQAAGPFPHVALLGAGAGGQLAGGRRPVGGEAGEHCVGATPCSEMTGRSSFRAAAILLSV